MEANLSDIQLVFLITSGIAWGCEYGITVVIILFSSLGWRIDKAVHVKKGLNATRLIEDGNCIHCHFLLADLLDEFLVGLAFTSDASTLDASSSLKATVESGVHTVVVLRSWRWCSCWKRETGWFFVLEPDALKHQSFFLFVHVFPALFFFVDDIGRECGYGRRVDPAAPARIQFCKRCFCGCHCYHRNNHGCSIDCLKL